MKIYLDENLSKYVALALNQLNHGYFPDIEVFSTIDVFGRGVPDETLIPEIDRDIPPKMKQLLTAPKTKRGVLLLPSAKIHYPAIDNFAWHLKYKFER